jgi:Tol biopolymer transport system component
LIGKMLAHFEVHEKIGEGGMGVVYQARDTKLGRDVALKVLPPSFLQDAERLARFRREAKMLASLNHANIASIYGLEEAEGQLFLVMELAAGEDLSERLERGAIGPDETLAIARQLVAGLEEAHENGVVHRDLKPANIKLSEDGKVKILDFGLARAWAEDPASDDDLANSPTITAAMTQAGVILGTAAYMSPEQARGKTVDRRADIWSLGVILFEMLTGERLFEGETVSDTLAGVLKTDVDIDRLPDDTPDELRWLIVRSLQRQPGKRLRDIGEARIALDGGDPDLSMSWSTMSMPAAEETPGRPARTALLIALALVVGVAASWFLRPMPEAAQAPGIRAALLAPRGQEYLLFDGGHFAMSPDGRQLAFVARDSVGTETLWVRKLGVAAPFQLSGTEDASYPFWSPDSEQIGFFTRDRLRKIAAGGGVATTVCPAGGGRGGSWTQDDRILFAPTNRQPIHIVSAAGGEPLAVTDLDSTAGSHRWPHVLPDDRTFLYTSRESESHHLYAGFVDGSDPVRILDGVLEGRYADGHIFFSRDNALWARPFDLTATSFTGQEFLVSESVVASDNFGAACYTTSERGNLVFAANSLEEGGFFVALDPDGNEEYRFRSEEGEMGRLDLSPDGKFMLMQIQSAENSADSDIWVRDLRRETMTRITSGENADCPRWSPNGDRIAYIRESSTLVIRASRGRREVLLETEVDDSARMHDWSPDGELLMLSISNGVDQDIYMIPVSAPEDMYALVTDNAFNVHGGFSPDSKWIVHMSTVTGTAEVYMCSVEVGGDSYQISTGEAVWPDWSPDGTAIYFAANGQLMAVDVDWSGDRPELGLPRVHREINLRSGRRSANQYTVRADGGFYYMGEDDVGSLGDVALDLVAGWRQLILGEQ